MVSHGLSDDNESVDEEENEPDVSKDDVPYLLGGEHPTVPTSLMTQNGRPTLQNQTISCPPMNTSKCFFLKTFWK